MTHYESIEAYYAENPARLRSPEVDFGVMWTDGPRWPQYRVSWVEATGEVYAMNLTTKETELLGYGGPDRETVDAVLDGWADGPLNAKPLQWVRDRVGAYSLGKARL